MQQSCLQCSAAFEISEANLSFYEKVSPVIGGQKQSVPPPTLCPGCRQQRRFAWRNERGLYHRRCDLTGKVYISNFAPSADIKAYEIQEWFSDKWDARTYGRDFDFSKTFSEQYARLQRDVPQLGLSVWNSENADYCSYVGHVRNCYLIFGSVYSEDCYYGSPYYSKDCVDTLVVRECERCYECIDCRKLHTCFYCQDCHSSNELLYCYDLQGCSECIGCAGLRNQKFCIFNKHYEEATYRTMKAQLDLNIPAVHRQLTSSLQKLSLSIPHRYMQSNQVENVSGNYLYESRNVHDSYYADRSQDVSYCAQVVDLQDCYDQNYTEENVLGVEYLGAYQNSRTSFSKFCNQVHDALYCDACHVSHDLFGCIGIRRGEYCVFNKQYTKAEYEALVPKIIAHMRKTGEWGEFFPAAISPFGYNESVAQEYFPLEEQEVAFRGWNWRNELPSQEKYLGPEATVPNRIQDVNDDICTKILRCEDTGKLFRIIEQELKFYREMNLPIPKKCPNARHLARLAKRNPRKLWDRVCSQCSKAIRTTYSPDRPETVCCEECYLSTLY